MPARNTAFTVQEIVERTHEKSQKGELHFSFTSLLFLFIIIVIIMSAFRKYF